jgi:pilus assembly protein CpaE
MVFLSYEAEEVAAEVAELISLHVPGTQVVAIHEQRQEAALMAAIRSGVREFLTPPFEQDGFVESIRRVAQHLERVPPSFHQAEGVFAFLPAKPGVGASTIAVNTSLAMTKQASGGVLLGDLDVYTGMVSFLLQLRHDVPTVLDAAELSPRMDETLWGQLACRVRDLDVLATARLKTGLRLDTLAIRQILDYARRTYSAICFDLSGGFEDYSVEVLQEARRIMLVCTPEICALRLAREKVQFLREMEIADKVSLIVNRADRASGFGPAEIERVVGMPVQMSIPNDYGAISRAIADGQPVSSGTDLGSKFQDLASLLLQKEKPRSATKRRFLEQFTLAPRLFFGKSDEVH